MTHTRSHMNVGLDLEIITTFYVNNAVGRFSKLWNVNISKCIKMDIEPYISQPTICAFCWVLLLIFVWLSLTFGKHFFILVILVTTFGCVSMILGIHVLNCGQLLMIFGDFWLCFSDFWEARFDFWWFLGNLWWFLVILGYLHDFWYWRFLVALSNFWILFASAID